jgi:hypothetical protein
VTDITKFLRIFACGTNRSHIGEKKYRQEKAIAFAFANIYPKRIEISINMRNAVLSGESSGKLLQI